MCILLLQKFFRLPSSKFLVWLLHLGYLLYLIKVTLTYILELKESNSLHFKPFKPLANYSRVLDEIEYLISVRDYEAAKNLSENLRSLALEGLHYFQTYDWLMLMTFISLGYVGWMIYLILHVLQSYTLLPVQLFEKEQVVNLRDNSGKVHKLP